MWMNSHSLALSCSCFLRYTHTWTYPKFHEDTRVELLLIWRTRSHSEIPVQISSVHYHDMNYVTGLWHIGQEHKHNQFSSVTQLCLTLCDPNGLQHARPPCPSPTAGAYSNSCPLSQSCHPTISSSVIPFSSCLQSFPSSGSFPVSQFFTSGSQSTGVSASAWVLPMNIQDWFHLGLTGLISLQSKGLSKVFSNTTVQKHQSFGDQVSL